MAGAKTPPRIKYPAAGVCRDESGMRRRTSDQKITALVPREISEPVSALECPKPRLTKTWPMEKNMCKGKTQRGLKREVFGHQLIRRSSWGRLSPLCHAEQREASRVSVVGT